ncbi:response regulator [uncultured Pseudodesulfovibrio sp.]|uniref:response regulator n=1 Tax=uncultured Pseudodesulfovibrio sp. TaxID=2035858 RepID=UPI0029C744D7|nr:response regulator [uncultured Pseudodesulfovibrio sp.]
MNVLIVDTDEAFRGTLARRLAHNGLTVHATGDAREGRVWACEEHVDAVLVGLSSPKQALLAFIRKIMHECPDSKVILINHSGNVPLSIEAMKLGARDEVGAPVDIEELVRKIETIRNDSEDRR